MMTVIMRSICSARLPLLLLLLLLLLEFDLHAAALAPTTNATASVTLSRKKRFVAFPEGSSVSGALCLTMGVIGNPEVSYLSYALNWGVAYDLPNSTWVQQNAYGIKDNPKETKPMVQRRSRRELFEKIELLIDDMGFNGHACIARALCESSKYLNYKRKRRGNMMEEILKTIFSLPKQAVQSHEPEAVHQYDRIYRRAARDVLDCSMEYSDCHFSLLELALGKYSVAPQRYGLFDSGFKKFSFM